MKIKDLMRRGVQALEPDATVEDAARRMADAGVGSLPVVSSGRPVGVVTDRDIVVRALAEGLKPKETAVESVMTPEVVYCREDDEAADAAKRMAQAQVRRLLVLDAKGALVGVVSLGDLAVEGEPAAREALAGVSAPSEELSQGTHSGGPRLRGGGEGGSLSSLIKDELAAAETYRQALETVRGAEAEDLRRFETEHEEAARVLQAKLAGLGVEPPAGTGLWGAWARAIEGSERFFDERAVLKILKLGEERGAADYEEALRDPAVGAELRALIVDSLLPAATARAAALGRLVARRRG
ncbi:MAG: CBS domain-containing protein [Elusimicrobiota bacterium]|nr:MAG: CBS domain-containing protein [Elusimicrobiota bacterium]